MTSTIKAASRRTTAFLAVLLVVLCFMTQTLVPKPVHAAFHQAYIQTTLDTSNWEILAGAVDVTSGAAIGREPQEYQRMQGLLETLAGCEYPSDTYSYLNTEPSGSGSTKKNLILTFPGEVDTSWGMRQSSTEADLSRASLVRNSLIYDLNSAFKLIYGYDYNPSGSDLEAQIDSYWSDMSALLRQVNGGTGNLNGYNFSTCSSSDISRFPDSVTNETDYVKITDTDGNEYVFQYRMLKGYVDSSDRTNVSDTLQLRKGDSDHDVTFIHWGHLAVEASVNFNLDEDLIITADNVYNSTPTAFEKAISSFFVMIANGISSALGLWSFDDLIFNAGIRGTSAYVGGIFPTSWQSIIWAFFFIFEIAAVVILLYAIIFNVGRRAMATMNPIVRANAIDQIQYLFMVALALGLLPIVLQLLINVNMNLTGIFTDALGGITAVERFKNLAASSGSLISALTSIVYLGAVIYFNVFYGIRSLLVAFLIITGPIFIAMMGISESKRGLTIAWAKELAANIFIQPLQAMLLSFILLIPSTTRSIDSLVMVYAMIPLTNVLRGLFFGNSGGLVHQMAERGKQSGMRMIKSGAKLAGAGAVGAVAGGAAAFGAIRGKSGEASESGKDEQKGKEGEQNAPSGNPANKSGATEVSKIGEGVNPDEKTGEQSPEDGRAGKVESGTATGATGFGKQLRQRMSDKKDSLKEGWAAVKAHPLQSAASVGKKGLSAAGTVAAGATAVGLGAIGGAQKNISRRLFDMNNGGAVATQLSRSMASVANKRLHPVENNATAAPTQVDNPESTNPDMKPMNPNEEPAEAKNPDDTFTPKYSDVTSDKGNVFEREIAEEIGNQYRLNSKGMKDAGIHQPQSVGKNQAMVAFDMDKLGAGDSARTTAMLDMWNGCNEQERAILQEAGITDVKPRSKMVNGEKKVTGVDMTVNPSAYASNFGTSFDKSGMTVTTNNGAPPQIVPDVAGYVSQVKDSVNKAGDPTAAYSAVEQVAQNMGIEQGSSATLSYPHGNNGEVLAGPPTTSPTVTFSASSQEALTNFMNEVPQLETANANIVPISENGGTRYQVDIPKDQYHGLMVTQDIPDSQVYSQIMSEHPAGPPAPEYRPPQPPVPAPQVREDSGQTRPAEALGEQEPIRQEPVKDSRDRIPVREHRQEEPRPQQSQKDVGNYSREQEKQGGQFRH